MTNLDAPNQILDQLKPSEKLLWSGRPRVPTFFAAVNFWLVAPGLFAGYQLWKWWPNTTFTMDNPGDAIGFAALAVIVLNCLLGHAIVERLRLNRTSYGVTDSRIIISYGIVLESTREIPLDRLEDPILEEANDGTGTINFDTRVNPFRWPAWSLLPWPWHNPDLFERVENPQIPLLQIRQAIERWQETAPPPPPPPGLLDMSRYADDDQIPRGN